MFSFGTWAELVVIGLAMVIFFKPEDYPFLMKKGVRLYRQLQGWIHEVSAPIKHMKWEVEAEEFEKEKNRPHIEGEDKESPKSPKDDV